MIFILTNTVQGNNIWSTFSINVMTNVIYLSLSLSRNIRRFFLLLPFSQIKSFTRCRDKLHLSQCAIYLNESFSCLLLLLLLLSRCTRNTRDDITIVLQIVTHVALVCLLPVHFYFHPKWIQIADHIHLARQQIVPQQKHISCLCFISNYRHHKEEARVFPRDIIVHTSWADEITNKHIHTKKVI